MRSAPVTLLALVTIAGLALADPAAAGPPSGRDVGPAAETAAAERPPAARPEPPSVPAPGRTADLPAQPPGPGGDPTSPPTGGDPPSAEPPPGQPPSQPTDQPPDEPAADDAPALLDAPDEPDRRADTAGGSDAAPAPPSATERSGPTPANLATVPMLELAADPVTTGPDTAGREADTAPSVSSTTVRTAGFADTAVMGVKLVERPSEDADADADGDTSDRQRRERLLAQEPTAGADILPVAGLALLAVGLVVLRWRLGRRQGRTARRQASRSTNPDAE